MRPNLERHPLHRGCYIAYDATGKAFRCSKSHPDLGGWAWLATPSHAEQASDSRRFYDDRLGDLADRIAKSEQVITPTASEGDSR